MFNRKSFDLFRSFDQSRSNRSIDPKNRSLKMEHLEDRHLLSVSPLDFTPQTMDSSISFDEMTEQEQAAFTAETLRSRLQGYGVNTMVTPLVFGPLTYVQQQAISSGLAVRSASQSDYSLLNDGEFSSVFVVDTLQDNIDPTDGKVSLREAICSANFFAGHDLITFAPGLTGTIHLNGTALPTIFESVNITGPGADVVTIDAGGHSRIFVIIGGGSTDVNTPAPSTPTGLTGKLSPTGDSVILNWNDSTDATGYAIYRKDSYGLWQLLDTALATTYTDTILTMKTAHHYRVVAYSDLTGKLSAPSNSVSVTTFRIDLDIDSDNTAKFSAPDRFRYEDQIENDPDLLGKLIYPNYGDQDGDGVLDIWDGYNGGGQYQSGTNASEQFVPLVLTIPDEINLSDMKFQIDYWMGSTTMTGYTSGSPPRFGDGNIRIWKKDGTQPRSANGLNLGGDLVMSYTGDQFYTAEQLGFSSDVRTITFYVEGHSASSQMGKEIKVSAKYRLEDGSIVDVEDTVRYTIKNDKFSFSVDSDNDGIISRLSTEDQIEENDPGKLFPVSNTEKFENRVPVMFELPKEDFSSTSTFVFDIPDQFVVFTSKLGSTFLTSGQYYNEENLGLDKSGIIVLYVAAFSQSAGVAGTISVTADPDGDGPKESLTDSIKMKGFNFDVDMNTDNFNGTVITSGLIMPERNEREELYEDHGYGLGIVMLTDEPLTAAVDPPLYYPLVLEISDFLSNLSASPLISFEHVVSSEPGGVELYKKVNNSFQLLEADEKYTLQQLGFTGASSTITLFVLPTRKHQISSEWMNSFDLNSKPDSEIIVTFTVNTIELKENIHYIVSSQGSFWNNYLHDPSIRHALASHGVYGSNADTPTAHATPTSLDLPNFALQWIRNNDLITMGFDAATAAMIRANNTNGLNVGVYYDHITGNAILAYQGSDPLALARPVLVDSGLFDRDTTDWSSWYFMWGLNDRIEEALNMVNSGAITGSSAPDWICNSAQSMGYQTPQYDVAMIIASHLPKNFTTVNNATSINKFTGWTITGHSLGGGLASAAAGVCGDITGPQSIGHRVDTFNAAGLHPNTVQRFLAGSVIASQAITAFRAESDELTEGQEEYFGSDGTWFSEDVPDAVGVPYWLEDFADDSTGAGSENWPGHALRSVFQGLLVDRIGRQLGVNYIIDSSDDVCLRGGHHQPSAGTTRITTTLYAF